MYRSELGHGSWELKRTTVPRIPLKYTCEEGQCSSQIVQRKLVRITAYNDRLDYYFVLQNREKTEKGKEKADLCHSLAFLQRETTLWYYL